MAYEPQTWADGKTGGTPITATALNHLEQGVANEQAGPKGDPGAKGDKGDKGDPGEPGAVTQETFDALEARVAALEAG